MDDLNAMRRQLDSICLFTDFPSDGRSWWIYLRAEIAKVVVRHDLPELVSLSSNQPDQSMPGARTATGSLIGTVNS